MTWTIRNDIWRRWNPRRGSHVFFETATREHIVWPLLESEANKKQDRDKVFFFHRIISGKSLREKRCLRSFESASSFIFLLLFLSYFSLIRTVLSRSWNLAIPTCECLDRHTDTHTLWAKKRNSKKKRDERSRRWAKRCALLIRRQ